MSQWGKGPMTKEKVKEYIELMTDFHLEDRCTVDEIPKAKEEYERIIAWIDSHCADTSQTRKAIFLIEGTRRGMHVAWVIVAGSEGEAQEELIDHENVDIAFVMELGPLSPTMDQTPRILCTEEP